MSDEKIPDRIKAKLTIELDFAKEDQPLIGEVLQGILDNLGLSSEGSGSRTAQSHYSYKLESNLPKVPMTMERLFDLMDQATRCSTRRDSCPSRSTRCAGARPWRRWSRPTHGSSG